MKTLIYAIASAFLGLFVLVLGVLTLYLTTPDAAEIKNCPTAAMTGVVLCEKSPHYVRLSNISKYVIDAVVLSEDASFYQHDGFDWYEIQNSFRRNWDERRLARGGSTITQQLAKNVFLSSDKTFTRKITEAFIARDLEKILTKSQILEYYLNAVEFGPNVYGIKPASQHYFQKHPSELNVVEAAYLAFLLPSPNVYSRSRLPDNLTPFADSRIRRILANLRRYGRIDEGVYIQAKRYLGDNIEDISEADDYDDYPEDESEIERMLRLAEDRSATIKPSASDSRTEEFNYTSEGNLSTDEDDFRVEEAEEDDFHNDYEDPVPEEDYDSDPLVI